MNQKNAIRAIDQQGILLVYPIDNRKQPPSLWSSFYPRSEMRWDWDESGDNRVADLWHLRTELSRSGKVVYAKWFRGRATFFSREIFTAFLAVMGSARNPVAGLGSEARQILEVLEMDSPLSTKQIKRATDLRGKTLESTYERALKSLWQRLVIVGFGEFEDGAFPSLGIGSAKLLFEDLWNDSASLPRDEAFAIIRKTLPQDSLFLKQLVKQLTATSGAAELGAS